MMLRDLHQEQYASLIFGSDNYYCFIPHYMSFLIFLGPVNLTNMPHTGPKVIIILFILNSFKQKIYNLRNKKNKQLGQFSCSEQQTMSFFLAIDFRMPTIIIKLVLVGPEENRI